MSIQWSRRHLCSSFIRQCTATSSTHARPIMLGTKRNQQKQPPGQARPEKRPPLTHFLCLPLVNHSSLSQLESSIEVFRAAHPPHSSAGSVHDRGPAGSDVPKPLIPEGAIRPLGTLHLTIGVMSLPSKERFDEAIAFFHSIDLAGLMHEAERVAAQRRRKQDVLSLASAESSTGTESPEGVSERGPLQPLTISLESLRALPRSKAATVLHASPVDPTGRLYPFCLMLRDKFLEAGFLAGEFNGNKSEQSNSNHEASAPSSGKQSTSPPLEAEHAAPVKEMDPYTAALKRTPKPRPLLLHTTLVNTIYVRGRHKPEKGADAKSKNAHKWPKRIEFDARDLIARYQDYYLDHTRTAPRLEVATAQLESPAATAETSDSTVASESNGPSSSVSASETEAAELNGKGQTTKSRPQFPFVWAKDIEIDSVCICEMGAKKLDIAGDVHPEIRGLNSRLGEKYTVVTQRDLNFSQNPSTTV